MEAQTLEAGLQTTKTRFRVASVLSAFFALLAVVGLLSPGTGAIFGLLSGIGAAFALSYAVRQRAGHQYYGQQLEALNLSQLG